MAEKPKTIRVTVENIADAVKNGMPISCATCTHFYRAQALGQESCGKTQCGGPIVGRDFPDYSGQLPRSKFSTICLMCGTDKIAYHVAVKEARFGLCEEHKDTFTGIITNPTYNVPQNPPIIIPLI